MRGTKFWHIRHPFSWYKDNPNLIDISLERANINWKSIEKEDKVVYYSHEKPTGIIGLFRVASKEWTRTVKGKKYLCYDIEPLYLPYGGKWPLEFSPKRDVGLSLKPMGSIVKLNRERYMKIKSFILGMNEPTNHEGVVVLFSKIHREIGYPLIKEVFYNRYPDAIVEDFTGREKRIEFEVDSDDFRKDMERGKHDPKECDAIVCWTNSWRPRPRRPKIVPLKPLYGS